MKDENAQNEALAQISQNIFGTSARLQIVNPRDLVLLKQNARFFKKDTFKQLVENIRADKRLSSVPLCRFLKDGRIEVLSGNHRVKAAMEAGLEKILVIVLLEDLDENRKIAIQLSHNALVGQDDQNILAELWAKIDDVQARLYAGLSSDTLNEIKKVELVQFSTPPLYTKTLTFAFTDTEKDHVEGVLQELAAQGAKEIHLAPLSAFDDFFNLLLAAKKKFDVKNSALAMLALIDIAAAHLEGEK